MAAVTAFEAVVLEGHCRRCGTVRAQVTDPVRWGRAGRVTCPGCGARIEYERVGRAVQAQPWHIVQRSRSWSLGRRRKTG